MPNDAAMADLSPKADTLQELIKTNTWQKELKECFRDLPSLLDFIKLTPETLKSAHKIPHHVSEQPLSADYFPIRVPRPYASRIQPGDPLDPLLLQVLPLPAEDQSDSQFVLDPLGEAACVKTKGLLQKYQGRVLVIAHSSCAVHCRYCFRRHFPYDNQNLPPQQWQGLSDYLSQDLTLNELILSGGDPLTLKNAQLSLLNPVLNQNPHIKRLRIHTRFPVMIPQRIDEGFLSWAKAVPVPIIMVLHINHAQEIDNSVAQAIHSLHQAGIMILNQSVLLKGINDSTEQQMSLQEKLGSLRVQPYYLHMLDPVAGAMHFDVTTTHAQNIIKELQAQLPGYLVPKLVREEPGMPSKTPVALSNGSSKTPC